MKILRIHHMPRLLLAAIASACVATLIVVTFGVIGMYRDADARADRLAQAPTPSPTATPSPATSDELAALRDLFAYCAQRANWDRPPCSTGAQPSAGRTLATVQPTRDDDDDDGGDTTVTVRADPAPTTAPQPTATKKVTPPPSDGGQSELTDTVEDTVEETTETVEDVARRLTDVTASAIASTK